VETNTGIKNATILQKKSWLKAPNMNNWIVPKRLKTANKGLINFVAGHYIK